MGVIHSDIQSRQSQITGEQKPGNLGTACVSHVHWEIILVDMWMSPTKAQLAVLFIYLMIPD